MSEREIGSFVRGRHLIDGPRESVFVDGLVHWHRLNKSTVVDFGEQQWQSAANPDFRVTQSTRMATMMERRLARAEAVQRSLAMRLRASERAAAVPPESAPDADSAPASVPPTAE